MHSSTPTSTSPDLDSPGESSSSHDQDSPESPALQSQTLTTPEDKEWPYLPPALLTEDNTPTSVNLQDTLLDLELVFAPDQMRRLPPLTDLGDCPICLEPLNGNQGTDLAFFPCDHAIHWECAEIIMYDPRCPSCRNHLFTPREPWFSPEQHNHISKRYQATIANLNNMLDDQIEINDKLEEKIVTLTGQRDAQLHLRTDVEQQLADMTQERDKALEELQELRRPITTPTAHPPLGQIRHRLQSAYHRPSRRIDSANL